MNRQQRREAKKNGVQVDKPRNNFPVAPITIESLIAKYPDMKSSLDRLLMQARADGIAEGGIKASGEIYNLIWASVIIALHDRHDFTVDKLNQLVSDAVNHIDCVQAKFVTIEDLIGLVAELGVIVDGFDFSKVTHNARQTHDRLKVYFEEVENMNKQDMAFKLFEQGILDTSEVAKRLDVKINTVHTYKWAWKQHKLKDMPPEEFADRLFGADAVKKAEKTVKKALDLEKPVIEVTPEEAAKELKEVVKKIEEEVPAMEENKVVETQKKVLDIPTKSRKFEVKRTVEIAAEFGTYTIEGNVTEVMLETREMGLTKADLLAFAEELQAVAGEM